jgi:hypothetical protein
MGSLTLLLVVALTMQLAPMVVSAGPAARGFEQVRLTEPLRIVVGAPARRRLFRRACGIVCLPRRVLRRCRVRCICGLSLW